MTTAFKPVITLEGDPQRNQNQFLVLTSDEPLEITEVQYIADGQTRVTHAVETELDVLHRLPLFQDTLHKLKPVSLLSSGSQVEVAIRCRRLGAETVVKHSFLLQSCRKPGILKLASTSGKVKSKR